MRDTIFELLRLLAPCGATGYVRIRLHSLHLEFCMFCRHRILFFSIQMPMCMAAFGDAPALSEINLSLSPDVAFCRLRLARRRARGRQDLGAKCQAFTSEMIGFPEQGIHHY